MIVTCPSCETSFAVDESLLGPNGRKVRCGECAHRWHQKPEAVDNGQAEASPEPLASPASEQAPEPQIDVTEEVTGASEPKATEPTTETESVEDDTEAVPPPVRGPKLFDAGEEDILDDGERRFAVLGWSIFLVVFVLLACGFYFGQKPIVAFEPRFQKLYDLVGLTADDEAESSAAIPGEGLSIPAEKLLKSRKRIDGEARIVVEGIVVNETGQDQPVPTLRATVANADSQILARWYFEADSSVIGPSDEVSFGTSIVDEWGSQGIGISIIFVSDETEKNEPSIGPTAATQ